MTSLASGSRWPGPPTRITQHQGPRLPPVGKGGGKTVRRVRVILLGDSSVGKTSLMTRFTEGTFDPSCEATVVFDYVEKEVTVDDKRYVLHIVDTCGHERFKCLTQNFYRGTQICLLTFALDDLRSFCNLSKWRDEFVCFAGIDRASDFPFVVIGNKADLPREQWTVHPLNVQTWCQAVSGDLPYIEASAKTALNVEEIFHTAVKRLTDLEKQFAQPFVESEKKNFDNSGRLVNLTVEPNSRRSKCCD